MTGLENKSWNLKLKKIKLNDHSGSVAQIEWRLENETVTLDALWSYIVDYAPLQHNIQQLEAN